MSDRGRKGRILLYGYGLEVERLRNQGLSYNDIAKVINEEHPENLPINKDTIARYYNRLDHSQEDSTPIELVQLLKDEMEDVRNEVRKSSLPTNERLALLKFITYRENKLKARIIASSSLSTGYSNETRKVSDILIKFSLQLCEDCRKKTVELLGR